MNILLRMRKDMVVTSLVPFRYLVYAAMLSDVVPYKSGEDGVKYGVFSETCQDLYDRLPDWDHSDDRRNELFKALNDLMEEGLVWFDSEHRVYLGEFRGKKFFTFEVVNSLFDKSRELFEKALKAYGKSKSAKDRSRSLYIGEQFENLMTKGVTNLTPGDFTDLHGYAYEVYTGGEIYILRGKVEHFQTTNMLKAYDKSTGFSLIIESTLNYETYRKKGMPTLTNVACMKDDVFRSLTRGDSSSKEYMREITSSINESNDSDF